MCLSTAFTYPEVVLWPWPNYKADWKYTDMGYFEDHTVCYLCSKKTSTTFLRELVQAFSCIDLNAPANCTYYFFSCVHHSYHLHTKIFLAELVWQTLSWTFTCGVLIFYFHYVLTGDLAFIYSLNTDSRVETRPEIDLVGL